MILHTMLRGRIEPTDTDAVIRSMQVCAYILAKIVLKLQELGSQYFQE